MTATLPGVNVTTASTPAPRSVPTSTGPTFIALMAYKGPDSGLVTVNDGIRSMTDYERVLGPRQSYSVAYDWAETYFREGGNLLYPARVVGPAAVAASLNLTGTGTTLVVTAKNKGVWANTDLKVEVINGPIGGAGTRVIIIRDANNVELERTQEFATQALGAAQTLTNVTITVGGGSGLPNVIAATLLSGGNDDRGSITQTQIDAALARLDFDLGPGQVVSPDWQTDAAHISLHLHAQSRNRFAVDDPVDTTVKATLLSAAAAIRANVNNAYGALVAPWLTIPSQASGGTGRSVPASALYCARAAVTDAEVSPNQAPAGRWGVARYVTGVKATFSRVAVSGVIDAADLNDAGVNLVILKNGAFKVYGNRTLVDPAATDTDYLQASNARYRMWTVARALAIGEDDMFARINTQSIEAFHSALTGLLLGDYLNGDLFGDLDDDRPETAFNVVTADPVNTATTINAGQLNAALTVRPVKGAETVNITITATALTEPVA